MATINDFVSLYFHKTRQIIQSDLAMTTCTMQFFQRHPKAMLCGMKTVLTLLQKHVPATSNLEVAALRDGSIIQAEEPVLQISGFYPHFGHFEGLIDGILAQATTLATNAWLLQTAADPTPIIYMNDRHSGYWNQPDNGYAAYVGGIRLFTSAAEVSLIQADDYQVIGTLPHALIQHCKGDTVLALTHYKKHFPDDQLIALVDYDNDVIGTSLACAKAFPRLAAVRIDTAPNLLDKSLVQSTAAGDYGTSIALVRKLRTAFDSAGFSHVKIIVSSGFNAAKIQAFRQAHAPVDYFGVGAEFENNSVSFTGDCVKLNQEREAKAGRCFRPNRRLETIAWSQVKR